MCMETEAGMVQSIGEIKIENHSDLPRFLQKFRYVIFEEAEDMLGLKYHAVCADLELDSRGTMPKEAYRRLKDNIHSFIDVTLRHASDKSKAYAALKEQINSRDETRELVDKAYKEALEYKQEQLLPISEDLHYHIFARFQEEPEEHGTANFYISVSDDEEIENMDWSQQISEKKLKEGIALSCLLNSNLFRKKKMFMV